MGTDRTLISPFRYIEAIMNVVSRRTTPNRRIMIPELSKHFIRNTTAHFSFCIVEHANMKTFFHLVAIG
jgi:hypothetical protein